MKIFLSTAWIRNDVKRLEGVINHIDGIEINSIGDKTFSKEIYNFTKTNNLKISSIHASAGPHKEQENAYYLPNIASLDNKLRKYDIDQLMLTAEWAVKIGVNRIVVHAGNIDDKNIKKMFLTYKEQFIKGVDNYQLSELKQAIMKYRTNLKGPYIDSLIKSIEKVCNSFPEIGFYLETRLNYYELPSPEEAEYIIDSLKFKNLGYWNDIGHAYIEDRLGFITFDQWKSNLNNYCGGLHIHDINNNLRDHYPPGLGSAPILQMLTGFPEDIPWVLEINSRHTTDEIINGINLYRELIYSILYYQDNDFQ